jgi:hypothetical protein
MVEELDEDSEGSKEMKAMPGFFEISLKASSKENLGPERSSIFER